MTTDFKEIVHQFTTYFLEIIKNKHTYKQTDRQAKITTFI